MEEITLSSIWTVLAWVAAAIVLLANAAEKIAKMVQTAKAPNAAQDDRLSDLEEWRKEMDAAKLAARVEALEGWRTDAQDMLTNDKKELRAIHDGMRVNNLVQLALLDHALNGNNITQMQDAKDALQKYLANK